MDPLLFSNGVQFLWRNGDVIDPSGLKCMVADGNGTIAGSPTVSEVTTYAWAYTW